MATKKWPEVQADARFRGQWSPQIHQCQPLNLPKDLATVGSLKDANPLPKDDRDLWTTAVIVSPPAPAAPTPSPSTTLSSLNAPTTVEVPSSSSSSSTTTLPSSHQPPNSGFFGNSLRAMSLYKDVVWGKPDIYPQIVPIKPGDIWYIRGDMNCCTGICSIGGRVDCHRHPGEGWTLLIITNVKRDKKGNVKFAAMRHGQTSRGIRPGVLFCTVSGEVNISEKKGEKVLQVSFSEDGTVLWDPKHKKTGYEAMYCTFEGVVDVTSESTPVMKGRFYAPSSQLKKFGMSSYVIDPHWLRLVGNLYNNHMLPE